MKNIILILSISLLSSTTHAISFYYGEWTSTDQSCKESKGHLVLSIRKNNMFSLAMFCTLKKDKDKCVESESDNIRLSMAYGKIKNNGELVITKYEGYKPNGIILHKSASGSFSSNTNCKGNWEAKH